MNPPRRLFAIAGICLCHQVLGPQLCAQGAGPWILSVNGQSAQAHTADDFVVGNISAPDLFGPGGPGTRPDFVSDDFVRVIGVSSSGGTNRYTFSEFFQIRQGETTFINDLTFTDTPPRQAERLEIITPSRALRVGTTNHLQVIAHYADGSTNDVTRKADWTSYRVSNVNVMRVDANGLVTVKRPGVAYITAINEGVAAVTGLAAVGSDDGLTAVTGFLHRPDGTPAVGASVSLSVGDLRLSAHIGADGRFTFINVPTTFGALTLSSVVVEGRGRLVAIAKNLMPVAGSMADVGILTLGPFPEGPRIKTVAAGSAHTLAFKTDGSLWAWGHNQEGQLGDGTTSRKLSPVRIGTDTDWTELAAGPVHTVARKSDGSLWAWGQNGYGQLGDGTFGGAKISPVRVGTDNDWATVDAGGTRASEGSLLRGFAHTVALKTDGSLWAWGENSVGQLGDGTTVHRSSPVRIGSETNWAEVAAGEQWTVARRTDGSLWGWGRNDSGQLGDGTTVHKSSPVQIGSDTDWAEVAVGSAHTVARKTDGSLWAWGLNTTGGLGDGTTVNRRNPVRIGTENDWAAVAAGERHTMAFKIDSSLWAWGANGQGQLGDGTARRNSLSPVRVGTDTDWLEVTAGRSHTVARKADGSLWAWGDNPDGQMGVGTSGDVERNPVRVGSDAGWTEVATGNRHTLARKTDGGLWAWGDNSSGGLGDGTAANKLTPVRIGSDTDWVEVVAGNSYSLARKSNGSLWGWGDNFYGQLGVGTFFDNRLSPVRVGTDTDWLEVAAGSTHALARKTDGSLWAWGGNGYGQLGDGTTIDKLSPAQIGTNADWLEVTAGERHSLARKTDGSLWAWGDNFLGQLGDGTTSDSRSPVRVGTDTDWLEVTAGGRHNLARKTNGSLWAWGGNRYGQLGDGTTRDKLSPVRVGTDTDWLEVIAGGVHTVARKTDGSLWAWGGNTHGQLGDGTATGKLSPVRIGADNNWASVAGGGNGNFSGYGLAAHTVARKTDGSLWSWGDNSYGQLGIEYIRGPIGGTYDWGLPSGPRTPRLISNRGSTGARPGHQPPALASPR